MIRGLPKSASYWVIKLSREVAMNFESTPIKALDNWKGESPYGMRIEPGAQKPDTNFPSPASAHRRLRRRE
jgi:hypothetical protein